MITGVMAYATSPIWFVVLLLQLVRHPARKRSKATSTSSRARTRSFPTWPEYRTGEIAMLLTITIVVLLSPKVLGATLVLVDKAQRKAFGGTRAISVRAVRRADVQHAARAP